MFTEDKAEFPITRSLASSISRAVWEKLVNWKNLVELRLECWLTLLAFVVIQSTPDKSNLQGKSKNVRVIGSSKKIAASKEKNSFYCTVNIVITFNFRNVKWKLKDTSRL